MSSALAGIVEGIPVIDLALGMSGPMVGMIPADYGAEVIPAGAAVRRPMRERAGHLRWPRIARPAP